MYLRYAEFWVLYFQRKIQNFEIEMEINFHGGCTITSLLSTRISASETHFLNTKVFNRCVKSQALWSNILYVTVTHFSISNTQGTSKQSFGPSAGLPELTLSTYSNKSNSHVHHNYFKCASHCHVNKACATA